MYILCWILIAIVVVCLITIVLTALRFQKANELLIKKLYASEDTADTISHSLDDKLPIKQAVPSDISTDSLPEIKKISYKMNNGNNEIVFTRIQEAEVHFKDYTPVSATISSITGSIGQLSPVLAQNASKGIFEATVPLHMLTPFRDGSFSTMIQGTNGEIIQHAGFKEVTQKLLTPLLIFQVSSFVIGQYYLHTIQTKFKKVSDQLESLKRFAKHDKLAELENIQTQIRELAQIQHPQIEHLVLINTLNVSIGKLIWYYINEIKRFEIPQQRDNKLFEKRINSLKDEICNDDFGFQMQMVAAAEEIQQIIRYTSLYLNCKYIEKEPTTNRGQYINEIIEQIMLWNPNNTFTNKEGKHITVKYYDEILQCAQEKKLRDKIFPKDNKEREQFINDLLKTKEDTLSVGEFRTPKEFQQKLNNSLHEKCHMLLAISEDSQPTLWIRNE